MLFQIAGAMDEFKLRMSVNIDLFDCCLEADWKIIFIDDVILV